MNRILREKKKKFGAFTPPSNEDVDDDDENMTRAERKKIYMIMMLQYIITVCLFVCLFRDGEERTQHPNLILYYYDKLLY